MEPRIDLLAPDSPAVDAVFAWHWREWSAGHEDPDPVEWRARAAERTRADGIPFTLVAWLDDEPVGSIAVCHDDLDERYADRGPWLSGVYVVGAARNLGVGRALLDAVCGRARSFGVTELWLKTGEASAFYERCGWTLVHRKESLTDDAVLMQSL
ncbi:MAG TPA: GNAT family N-acetyltransferase [Acidimicrobiia bacterium]|nr:GNAT family N-acetyltransferase [Acidimicrobiia bacterium]